MGPIGRSSPLHAHSTSLPTKHLFPMASPSVPVRNALTPLVPAFGRTIKGQDLLHAGKERAAGLLFFGLTALISAGQSTLPQLSISPAGPDVVTNGSFENGTTGWIGNSGVEINTASIYGSGVTAIDGTMIAEVEGSTLSPNTTVSYLSQTIPTVVGRSYQFRVNARTRIGNTQDRGQLLVGGSSVLSFTTAASWTFHSVVFVATSASTVIRIESNGSVSGTYAQPGDGLGLLLDQVQVIAVDNSVTYTENATGTTLASTATYITGSGNMVSASASLLSAQTGDRLLVNGSAAASGSLAGGITWTRTDLLVSFSGTSSIANYINALRAVQFHSTSEDPNTSVVRRVAMTVTDGINTSNAAHAYVTVSAVNDAPVAVNDAFTTAEGTALTGQSLATNDSDPDHSNAQLTWSLLSGSIPAVYGTVVVNANGTFSYTPFNDFSGTVTFTYQVCDPLAACATATVTITVTGVNDPPLVALSPVNLITNGSFESGTTGWTGNSGVEVNPVTSYGVPAAPHGTRVMEVECNALSPTTTAAYVQQTVATTIGRTYILSIKAVNRVNANTGDAGAISVNGNTLLSMRLTNTWTSYAVSFTATSTSTPIRLTSLGSVTGSFRPGDASGFIVDQIELREMDHRTTWTENTAAVPIGPATPVVYDVDHANMTEAVITLTNPQLSDRLLMNGSAAASGTVAGGISWVRTDLQVTLSGSATKAQYEAALELVSFINTSEDPNTAIVRDITVTVNDGLSVSNVAHTYITVTAVNDAPVAEDLEFMTFKNTPLSNQTIGGIDVDVDNPRSALTWSVVDGGTAIESGSLTLLAGGSFTFNPHNEFVGTVYFTYRVCDLAPLCDVGTITISVISALPVELLAFDGSAEGTTNRLFWSTATEQDNDRFEVQRSADGLLFETIGSLPGAGNVQSRQDYDFVHATPAPGVNYYRLRQVDFDGAFEYSNIIALNTTDRFDREALVIQLDAEGIYRIIGAGSEESTIELLNLGGQIVQGRITKVDGACTIDVRALPAGLYMAHMMLAGERKAYKLVRP